MKDKVFQSKGQTYSMNKPILFTPYGEGAELFKDGVYSIENGCFAWTKGRSFDFEIHLDEEEDLVVQMEFWSIYRGVQSLVVFANGRSVFRGKIEYPEIRFRIPKESMEYGQVKLSLIYPDAASPSMDDAGNNDTRFLAFGIRKIMMMDMEHAVRR